MPEIDAEMADGMPDEVRHDEGSETSSSGAPTPTGRKKSGGEKLQEIPHLARRMQEIYKSPETMQPTQYKQVIQKPRITCQIFGPTRSSKYE